MWIMIATRIVEKNDENGGNTTKIADNSLLPAT
jgi:hypothetical protein